MDLLNSMVWILSESMDLPDVFHSMEIYNYYGKSKFYFNKFPCNFHSTDFQPTNSSFTKLCEFLRIEFNEFPNHLSHYLWTNVRDNFVAVDDNDQRSRLSNKEVHCKFKRVVLTGGVISTILFGGSFLLL